MFDYYFWFAQPPTALNSFDQFLAYLFGALLLVSMVLGIAGRYIKHEIYYKLARKFFIKDLTVGLSGLVWVALRYESIPIFARRYWAGLLVISLVIWILWVVKYIIWKFPKEKREYETELVKSRYLPKSK